MTQHEPYRPHGIFDPVFETETGRVDIPGPHSFAHDPALSRYHPNNGWVVPDRIDVRTGEAA
jgi:hypothetical protein